RLEHRPGKGMGTDSGALLQDADVDVGLELLEADGTGETRGPCADDDDVVLHDVALDRVGRCGCLRHGVRLESRRGRPAGYFGCMRIAPSRRMVVPLSIVISHTLATSWANSSGRPSRAGNGTCAPSEACTSGGMPSIIGVWKIPGAIDTQRMPKRASSRAMGSVMPATPALVAE